MFEPTDEMKAAYKWARLCGQIDFEGYLADLAQHAMAAALEAEDEAQHLAECDDIFCGRKVVSKADWLKLADEKLRK